MFTKSVQYYDKIYSFKDYRAECDTLCALIGQHLRSGGRRLLDVACGTGRHIGFLRDRFEVEGLDISLDLLEVARQHSPDIPFHLGNMIDFDLGRAFDVVTCLFSSVGYVKTLENLSKAVASMARHLSPGGILIIEPWFTPENWHPDTVHATFIDEPELKIARVNASFANGRLSYFDLHHLIGTPDGTEHFAERHELGLFEMEEMSAAFSQVGLEVTYDADGLTGRGLYIGRRPE